MEKPDDRNDQYRNKKPYYDDYRRMSTQKLLRKIQQQGKYIIKKEIDLAKAELKADIKSEAIFTGGFAVGIAAASVAGILLLVTLIFALSLVMPGWLAGLIVSAAFIVVSIVAAIIGWIHRVKSPMVRTKEVINEDRKLSEGDITRHAA